MPKAININCHDAEDIEILPENTVMISINEEHKDLYALKIKRDPENVLTLRFTDLLASRGFEGRMCNPISVEDTYRILGFIKKHLGKDFIVHCAAGISRSAAICLYLHAIHGYELKQNFWSTSCPNKYVLGSLVFCKYETRHGFLSSV